MPAKTTLGYQKTFLGTDPLIGLPKINNTSDIVTYGGNKKILDYIHYSVVMSKSRKLAYFTAVNIDGSQWQDNKRKGTWKKDTRIKATEQLGDELYKAKKSDFDKGHLVKREDPEWGEKKLSQQAGKETFVFPNCTPQHADLNQDIWQELEKNILHTGAVSEDFKISVFTGPVLSEKDGDFVTPVKGEIIKIPSLFWKVVVWKKSDGKTYAVGFIMSQEKFLLQDGIIKKPIPITLARGFKDEDIFEHLEFKDGSTYQVKIEEIEKLAGVTFDWANVVRPFKGKAPKAITGTVATKMTAVALRGITPINRQSKMMLEGLELG